MKNDPLDLKEILYPLTLSEPDRAALEDARVGLIGWLAALEGYVRTQPAPPHAPPRTTVMVPDRAVANGFQVGFFEETGPFLAYPPAFWWFPYAWRFASAGPAGMALLADDTEPLVVLLPSDWPQAMTEFADLCRRRDQTLNLYPYAETYFTALESPVTPPERITHAADLDRTRGVSLPFPTPLSEEALSWLEPLLQSPWPE